MMLLLTLEARLSDLVVIGDMYQMKMDNELSWYVSQHKKKTTMKLRPKRFLKLKINVHAWFTFTTMQLRADSLKSNTCMFTIVQFRIWAKRIT